MPRSTSPMPRHEFSHVGALAKLRDVLEAGEPEERKAVVRTFLRGIRINQKAGQAS